MTDDNSNTSFCPELEQMLQSGRIELPGGDQVTIAGTSTLNNILTIRRLIQEQRPLKTLEIGLAYGASALTFLSTHREVHSADSYHHWAIDPFQASHWKSAAVHVIQSAGLADNFSLIEQDSALALPQLCSDGASFDLIYIDGSHIFEDVFIDFFYCSRLLSPNGLVLFDDCTDKHVRKVLKFIDSNYSDILARENVAFNTNLKRRIGHSIGIQQLVAYRKVGTPPREWDANFSNF